VGDGINLALTNHPDGASQLVSLPKYLERITQEIAETFLDKYDSRGTFFNAISELFRSPSPVICGVDPTAACNTQKSSRVKDIISRQHTHRITSSHAHRRQPSGKAPR
jgi:hypothetical protein